MKDKKKGGKVQNDKARCTYSPYFTDMAAIDGMSLLSIATYSHVPKILMYLRTAPAPLVNREVSFAIGVDESLCAKLMKYLMKNGLVEGIHKGKRRGAFYSLSETGRKCADNLSDIVAYGDLYYAVNGNPIQSIEKRKVVKT